MQPKQITPDLSVTAQIAPDDMAAIGAQGFRAILCNRPDGEDPDQPGFRIIAAAAASAGLAARHVPVTAGEITGADVAAFGAALAELPRPVLAYCRSGRRAAALWELHEAADGRPADGTDAPRT